MAGQSGVLVTGGTGFIGRYVVRQLLARGARVRLLCRSTAKAERLFCGAVEAAAGDLRDPAAVRSACRGIGTVHHLGGLYAFGIRRRRELWDTNVTGTENLLAACRDAGVGRVVHCSTAGILDGRRGLKMNADFPGRPPRGCYYKQSKWHAERLALEWNRRGLPVTVASPSAPIGAEDEAPTPTGRMILDLLRGRFPCCSRTGINLVSVDDVAAGVLAVADRGRPGERYVLGDRNLWLKDFLAMVALAAPGTRAPSVVMPWPVIAAAGALADLAGAVFGAENDRLCWETAYFARQRQFFDMTHTFETLGWRPSKPVEAAIADAVAWFSANPAAGGKTR